MASRFEISIPLCICFTLMSNFIAPRLFDEKMWNNSSNLCYCHCFSRSLLFFLPPPPFFFLSLSRLKTKDSFRKAFEIAECWIYFIWLCFSPCSSLDSTYLLKSALWTTDKVGGKLFLLQETMIENILHVKVFIMLLMKKLQGIIKLWTG